MFSSLGAMLRISLRRSRADWPIVFAAGLICMLAATLLAAGAIYANAVSIAGLHRVLADAPVGSANIAVSIRVPTADVDVVDGVVDDELKRVFGSVGGEVLESARSDSFALPDQPAGEVRALTVLGFADGLADHAALVDGAWPDGTAQPDGYMPVAVAERVAIGLGLDLGERLPLRSRLDDDLVVDAGSAPMVETQALSRDFRMGSSVVHALHAVDLRVERGELVAVRGRSG